MGTVIGEYSMSHNEREASSWFQTLKLAGAVVSPSGGNASNHSENFGNQAINGNRRCKCGKSKKDKAKCKCSR